MKKKLLVLAALLSSAGALAAATSPMASFQPSNLTQSEGEEAWKSMSFRFLSKGSTCSNRANAWAYEMDRDLGINSTKQFIHYSDIFRHVAWNYAKKPSYVWGFKVPGTGGNPDSPSWEYHVAPMITVEGEKFVLDKHFGEPLVDKKTGEYVLDYRTKERIYVNIAGIERAEELKGKPFGRKEWLDSFSNYAAEALNNPSVRSKIMSRLRKNAKKGKSLDKRALALIKKSYNSSTGKYETKCEETAITNIVEHDQPKRDSWCHAQETSMYYWTPQSLRLLNYGFKFIPAKNSKITSQNERNGSGNTMTRWQEYILKASYSEAFGTHFEF